MKLNALNRITERLPSSKLVPVLFPGHGSPMNTIEENEFVAGSSKGAREIPSPNAIIVVSGHWQTAGTMITAMEQPETIHDFDGSGRTICRAVSCARQSSTDKRSQPITCTKVALMITGVWTTVAVAL